MADVHAFCYRSARVSVEYPVELCIEQSDIAGFTKDVSDTGLLVRLTRPVNRGSYGKLRWRFGSLLIELDVCVVSTDFLEAGLSFRFASDSERQFIRTMLKALTKGMKTQQP